MLGLVYSSWFGFKRQTYISRLGLEMVTSFYILGGKSLSVVIFLMHGMHISAKTQEYVNASLLPLP